MSLEIDSEDSELGISGSAGDNIVIFSPDYENVSNNLKIIDLYQHSLKILKEIKVNHGGISDIKVRKDRKIFATAGWDHRIRIFNYKKLSPLAILKGHTENILSID